VTVSWRRGRHFLGGTRIHLDLLKDINCVCPKPFKMKSSFRRNARLTLVFLIISLLSISCAPKEFVTAAAVKTEWQVRLNFDSAIDPALQEAITKKFQDFTLTYSSVGRVVKFYDATDSGNPDMIIHVQSYKAVTNEESAVGLVVTMIGIAMPIVLLSNESPFVFAFWYFPKTESVSDIFVERPSGERFQRPYKIRSSGSFKSPEKQFELHAQAYYEFFFRMAKAYEKEYTQLVRKR
jgi:hypothetical protein